MSGSPATERMAHRIVRAITAGVLSLNVLLFMVISYVLIASLLLYNVQYKKLFLATRLELMLPSSFFMILFHDTFCSPDVKYQRFRVLIYKKLSLLVQQAYCSRSGTDGLSLQLTENHMF